MVSRLLLLAVALGACVDPDYVCHATSDCDVGTAGRCELDHRCTAIDATCPTHRRYSDHSGPVSGQCYDDSVAPSDPCAPGQPPAVATGCAASVCDALPSCCTTGWSEACVQQAQIQCAELQCDTRIAITAGKSGKPELWDVRWNGTSWSATEDTVRKTSLSWLPPGAGVAQPRLAGFLDGALSVDGATYPLSPDRSYLDATAVDFDRDGRPTAMLAFTDLDGPHLQVLKLDDASSRVIDTAGAVKLSWGDVDQDAYPDGIAEQASSARYNLASNIEAADHSRAIDDRVVTNVSGTSVTTDVPPALRSFDWLDIDGDHHLDVVAYGYSVDVHSGQGGAIGTSMLVRLDCDPPRASSGCLSTEQMAQSFAGAALPSSTVPALVLATQPGRALYKVTAVGTPIMVTAAQYSFPVEACGAMCAPIVAVVTRDLDGDHALDVIAIDANLTIYTGLAKDGLALHAAIKVPTTPMLPNFSAVRTSTTGAIR